MRPPIKPKLPMLIAVSYWGLVASYLWLKKPTSCIQTTNKNGISSVCSPLSWSEPRLISIAVIGSLVTLWALGLTITSITAGNFELTTQRSPAPEIEPRTFVSDGEFGAVSVEQREAINATALLIANELASSSFLVAFYLVDAKKVTWFTHTVSRSASGRDQNRYQAIAGSIKIFKIALESQDWRGADVVRVQPLDVEEQSLRICVAAPVKATSRFSGCLLIVALADRVEAPAVNGTMLRAFMNEKAQSLAAHVRAVSDD